MAYIQRPTGDVVQLLTLIASPLPMALPVHFPKLEF
jgi:hypothetical protein